MIKNIILSCFCIVSSLGFGQVQLPTYDFIDDAFTIKVNKFDFDVYRDSINGTLNGPHFFATPIKLDFDLKQLSKKTVLDNGYLYEVNIESKGALGLSIFFSSLELGGGSYLTISSTEDTGIIFKYTKENSRSFNFLSDVLLNENIKITYF